MPCVLTCSSMIRVMYDAAASMCVAVVREVSDVEVVHVEPRGLALLRHRDVQLW